MLIVFSVFLANREHAIGIDTHNYVQNFEKIVFCSCIDTTYFEIGFQTFTWLISLVTDNTTIYLFSIGFLLVFSFFIVIKLIAKFLFKETNEKLYIYFVIVSFIALLSSNFFLTAGINGIRQGLAAPLLFAGFIYFTKHKYLMALIFYVIACSFHLSSLLYVFFSFILFFNFNTLLFLSLFSFLSYFLGLTELFIKFTSEIVGLPLYDFVKNYSDTGMYEGFNLGFFAYSAIPLFLVIGIKVMFKISEAEKQLFSIYFALILPYLILGFGGYTNRYAFTAWLFIPLFIAFFVTLRVKREKYFLPGSIFILATMVLFFNFRLVGIV